MNVACSAANVVTRRSVCVLSSVAGNEIEDPPQRVHSQTCVAAEGHEERRNSNLLGVLGVPAGGDRHRRDADVREETGRVPLVRGRVKQPSPVITAPIP